MFIENRAFLYPPTSVLLKNYPADSYFYRTITFGFYFLNYVRSCIIIGESLNRFISILYIDKRNTKHEQWLKKGVYPFLLVSIVIALTQSWFYFWCTFNVYQFDAGVDAYGLQPQLTFMKTNGSLRSAIDGFLTGIKADKKCRYQLIWYHNCRLSTSLFSCDCRESQLNKFSMKVTLLDWVNQVATFHGKTDIITLVVCQDDHPSYNSQHWSLCPASKGWSDLHFQGRSDYMFIFTIHSNAARDCGTMRR
uniref:Serpentine receptor class gamma n=1 Tax=Panagrellus redivivus TaxID=6233 RepID=A0A7E4VTV9_PANRE